MMQKSHQGWMQMLVLALSASVQTACDSVVSAEPLSAITDAVTAAEDTIDATTQDGDGHRGHRGRHGERGNGEHGDRCDDSAGASVELPVCTPPVASDVVHDHPPHGPRHLVALYDADASGDLSDEELAALQADVTAGCEAKRVAALAAFDADGNGELSQAEWDALTTAKRAEREAAHAARDLDGDGEVSRAEREAARAADIAEFDTDGDGALSDEEQAAMRTALQALVRAGEHVPPLHGVLGEDRGPPCGPPPSEG
jgi:hypothetical protein